MAKKTVAPAAQIVHIPAVGAAGSTLSKEQKAFNRLTKRIAKLEGDITAFREAATKFRQRVQDEYRPLQKAHNDQRAALVRLLDKAYDTYKLTKTERNKIVDLIVHGCVDLLDRGYDDLEPIFDKHDPPLSAEEAAEAEAANTAADAQTAEMMKKLFAEQYGITFDPAADVSTPEKFQAYVAQQMAVQEAEWAEQEAQAAERRAKRRKSPKQQAAEAKKEAEAKNITQAVRTLYRDLVKHLHPDREPDEAEKLRKTELLKQVTTAYENNELLTLLRLQLELERIDQAHLENLAEDQLHYYNKLLREQVRDLEQALFDEQVNLSQFTGGSPYSLLTPAAMEYDYKWQKEQLEQKIKKLTADVLAFEHDPAALKAFLKTYKIPKAGQGPIMIELPL